MQENEKKRWLGVALTTELHVFGWIFFIGPHSIRALSTLKHKNVLLKESNVELAQQVTVLKDEVAYWSSNFAKEKCAREQLKMARKNDIVYQLS